MQWRHYQPLHREVGTKQSNYFRGLQDHDQIAALKHLFLVYEQIYYELAQLEDPW
jgi:hypothetical protein